jgi:hypothetical protein
VSFFALASTVTVARASGACGDGVVNSNEECDGGAGGLFVDGDPAKGSCTTGARCYFQFTCCKFNCQYVGTPGVPCQDGNNCTGPDTCDQIGHCAGGPNAANDTPCDDGVFCDGTESCQNGFCTASTGDPCSGTACNQCQEASHTCHNPAGSACSDGSVCVTGGTCDGAGSCNGGTNATNGTPCNDGLFCNGADTCLDGGCSSHSGDPCTGPDGDSNCNESCNETTDTCTGEDPNGSSCDNGLFCDGGADICDNGSCVGTGTMACDDNNSCTSDFCNELIDGCSSTTAPDGTNCDDGDPCTLNDTCSGGVCHGTPVTMQDLCPWTVVLNAGPKKDQIKTYFQVDINGDVCGGGLKLSGQTTIGSDLVSAVTTGDGVLRIAPDAIIGHDIVSGGAGAKSFPGSQDLPYLTPAAAGLAPGSPVLAKSDASGFYDFTGMNSLAALCQSARASYAPSTSALDALTSTTSMSSLTVATDGTSTITATMPGVLNVVDVTGAIKVSNDGSLTLDGGGNAATVMVLRVGGKFSMQLRTQIALAGGLTPDRTLIYVKGKKCQIGDLSLGVGTLFCSPARVKTGRSVAWLGAVYGDSKSMKLGEKSEFLFEPFTAF